MIPVTRKEQYLNRLTGEEQSIPETPITRTEQYLARLCGMETEIPSSPLTREEAYLAYLNGEDVTLPEPITRLEQFMAFAAEKSETKPTPLTREEFYWDKYQGGAVLKDFPNLPSSIVTVTDALAKPLDSLKVAITPVQSGSGDPSPENVRPISGWTGAKVANISDSEKQLYFVGLLNGTYGFVDLGTLNWSYHDIQNFFFTNILDMSITTTNLVVNGYVYVNKSWVSMLNGEFGKVLNQTQVRFHNDAYTDATSFKTSMSGVYLVYELATPTTPIITEEQFELLLDKFGIGGGLIPITFPSEAGTVYGGTLDVTNGTLTVTKANIESYDGETLPGEWMSDRDVYADGTTPTTGAQVVYDLDTPITYQLTPTEVQMLLGTNNIWADTGDILEGKYWSKNPVTVTQAMLNTLRDAGEVTEIAPEEQEEPEESDER